MVVSTGKSNTLIENTDNKYGEKDTKDEVTNSSLKTGNSYRIALDFMRY